MCTYVHVRVCVHWICCPITSCQLICFTMINVTHLSTMHPIRPIIIKLYCFSTNENVRAYWTSKIVLSSSSSKWEYIHYIYELTVLVGLPGPYKIPSSANGDAPTWTPRINETPSRSLRRFLPFSSPHLVCCDPRVLQDLVHWNSWLWTRILKYRQGSSPT